MQHREYYEIYYFLPVDFLSDFNSYYYVPLFCFRFCFLKLYLRFRNNFIPKYSNALITTPWGKSCTRLCPQIFI